MTPRCANGDADSDMGTAPELRRRPRRSQWRGRRLPRATTRRPNALRGRVMLKLGIVAFWKNYDRQAVIHSAQLAEELGYDSVWIPEAWAYEQFQLLTELALKTSRLKLATGIANVYSRS